MSATFGPQVPRCHLSGARHKGTERTQSWHISRGGEGHGERPAWAGGLQSLCAAQGSLSRTGWKRGVGRPSASWASSLCQPQTCPHPQNDAGPLAPLEGPGPQEGLLLPPLSADHLSRAFPEPGWSCQPQQCPPHIPLPASTGRGWPEARAAPASPGDMPAPSLRNVHPAPKRQGPCCAVHTQLENVASGPGLWGRSLSSDIHPQPGQESLQGAAPGSLSPHLQPQREPRTSPIPSYTHTPARPLQDQGRGLDLRSSSTHQAAEASTRGAARAPSPLGPGPAAQGSGAPARSQSPGRSNRSGAAPTVLPWGGSRVHCLRSGGGGGGPRQSGLGRC